MPDFELERRPEGRHIVPTIRNKVTANLLWKWSVTDERSYYESVVAMCEEYLSAPLAEDLDEVSDYSDNAVQPYREVIYPNTIDDGPNLVVEAIHKAVTGEELP